MALSTHARWTQGPPHPPSHPKAYKDVAQDESSLGPWGALCSKGYKRRFRRWLCHTHLVTAASFLSYFLGFFFVKKDNNFCSDLFIQETLKSLLCAQRCSYALEIMCRTFCARCSETLLSGSRAASEGTVFEIMPRGGRC